MEDLDAVLIKAGSLLYPGQGEEVKRRVGSYTPEQKIEVLKRLIGLMRESGVEVEYSVCEKHKIVHLLADGCPECHLKS